MKIFITGASSFLCGELINILKNKHKITVLEHQKRLDGKRMDGINVVRGGLENLPEWEKALSGIDVIIHLAGVTHPKEIDLYRKINTEGTRRLVESAEKHRISQFIFISTSAIGENSGAYGESKKEAEQYLLKSSLAYTILRVGPAYNDNFTGKEGLASLVSRAKKSFILPYLSDQNVKFSPIHRDDVLKAILASINNPKAYFKTYTLNGPESLSNKEIFFRILKRNNTKKLLIPIPTVLARIIFYISSSLFKVGAPDQMQRMLSKKEPLSENVLTDLGVSPRKFLS